MWMHIYLSRSEDPNQGYSTRGLNPIWDEKFIFSISDNSSMLLEIYLAHRWCKDSFIGKANCDLHSLFESIKIKEEECKYDTADEDRSLVL